MPEAEGSHASDGLATRDRAGHWGDPLGVRPYRRGDPLRRVHWGLTARHGELIVRELQSNAVPRVQIVLDAHPAAHAGSGPDGSREWAIRVAASLAEGWIGQGAEVELVLDGEPGPVTRRLGPGTHRRPCSMPWRDSAPAATGTSRNCCDLAECRRSRPRTAGHRHDRRRAPRIERREARRRAGDRFVVLKAGAFGSDEGHGSDRTLARGSLDLDRWPGARGDVPPAGREGGCCLVADRS